jgi:hypothetical protein
VRLLRLKSTLAARPRGKQVLQNSLDIDKLSAAVRDHIPPGAEALQRSAMVVVGPGYGWGLWNILHLGIVSGDLAAGARLPSTTELARRFRLHANTVGVPIAASPNVVGWMATGKWLLCALRTVIPQSTLWVESLFGRSPSDSRTCRRRSWESAEWRTIKLCSPGSHRQEHADRG